MAYTAKKTSSGIEAKMKLFEKNRSEAQFIPELRDKIDEIKLTKKLESDISETPSDKTSLRSSHKKFIKSCFDFVVNEKELIKKHEENKKLAIDNYINGNSINDDEKEALIAELSEEIDEDFDVLLILYKKKKELNPDQKQALENARKLYSKEMDKHFAEPKFILKSKLQELHEKSMSLSHDCLNQELKKILPKVNYELSQSLEVIYDQYKRQNLLNIPLKPAIGIDLGTTYCCVGVMNRGKVHIIADTSTNQLNTTPSYVSFAKDGQEFVGKEAKEEQTSLNPANTIFDVKRMIGRRFNDKHIQEDMKLWPFQVVEENDRLKVKLYTSEDITLFPEELSSKILLKLKKEAEDFLGFKVENAVITVPAYFNDSQRQATKDAGALAGLNVLQILNEPTAAAIAYYHQIKDDFSKKVLIYDLGGGTFDVAIVAIERGDIDVIAVGGDTHLGGVDFDQRILNHLYRKFEDNFRKCRSEDDRRRVMNRLRIQVEKAKWSLSGRSATNISVPLLQPNWDFNYNLTQSKFEDLCVDLFKKTIDITENTLKSANLKPSDINDIVLIGGSTKIPKIQLLLKKYFVGKSLNKEIRPDEAVAYGATVQAALLNGEEFINSKRAYIHDVSPYSLGVEILDKSMAVIIPRNSKIPFKKCQTFYTASDDQTFVFIQIFEGENMKIAKQNRLLGEFVIDGLPKKPTGQVSVDVTMDIDSEGILHVKGETEDKSVIITIKDNRGRISAEELQILVKQANYD